MQDPMEAGQAYQPMFCGCEPLSKMKSHRRPPVREGWLVQCLAPLTRCYCKWPIHRWGVGCGVPPSLLRLIIMHAELLFVVAAVVVLLLIPRGP